MTVLRLVHALALASTLFPAAATAVSRSLMEMRVLEARCFARCFKYNATATEGVQVWAPYSFAGFKNCSYPCSFFNETESTCLKKCRNQFGSLPDSLAECNEGCGFVTRVKSEAVGASFSPGSPYVPAIPSSPIVTQVSDVVTLQWEATNRDHSKLDVRHGPGRAAVFVIQYASIECGPPQAFDWKTGSHPAEQNFIELPHDSLDLSDDHLYVFRVATVNVNGTQGFSLTSPLAYSVDKKCVNVSHKTPGLVKDLRLLGFRNPMDSKMVDVEVSWQEPAMNKALCYYVCVREEASGLSQGSEPCRDRMLFDLIVAKHFVASKSDSPHGTQGCSYRSTVGSVPMLISTYDNRAVKTAVFRNVTKDMDDSSRFVSGTPSLSQVKTLSHHINVTVTWPLPVDYHPDLHRYRLEYGTGRHSVPILKEDSVKLGEKDIYVSDAVGQKFSVIFPELEPGTRYWFKILAVTKGIFGKTSEEDYILTEDFSVPGVPLHVSHVIKDGTLNRFSVLITWTNSKPATPMDYPVTASYVNWGFSRSINDNSEIAVATVNGTTEEYTISDLEKEDSDGSKKYYWFRVWSANAKGNGSESEPVYFSYKSPSDQLLVAYVASPLVFSVIVALVIAIVFYCHWRRKRQKIILVAHPLSMTSNLLYGQPPVSPCEVPDEWEVAANRISLDNKLGEGFFGEVWRANIKGTFGPSERHASVVRTLSVKKRLEHRKSCEEVSIPVAVKLLKGTATEEDRRDLVNEIKLMKRIGCHKHIVSMLGCCTMSELYLIVEFVPYGDLLNFLRKNRLNSVHSLHSDQPLTAPSLPEDRYVPPNLPTVGSGSRVQSVSSCCQFHDDGTPHVMFTPHLLLSFGHQITQGMEYLHSKDLVHRDLACRNVLVDDNNILKISDFGLCRAIYKDVAYVKKTKGRLPLKWMSIEAIFDREFTKQSDVWSFGVALWEICTMGGFPYPTIPNESLLAKLRSGYRMEKPSNCSQELYDLMLESWNDDPHQRPSFTDLAQIFSKMISSETHRHLLATDVNEDSEYYLLPIQLENLLGEDFGEDSEEDQDDEMPASPPPRYDMVVKAKRMSEGRKLERRVDGAHVLTNGMTEMQEVGVDYDFNLRVQLPSVASKQTVV